MNAPAFETERLVLRGHKVEDYDRCCELWADPQVARYISDRAFTAEEVWSRLLRHRGHWEMLGFGSWMIEEKKTGGFVGEAGFFDYKRDVKPQLGRTPEMGWVLASAYHGRGFATEVVRALLGWAGENLDTTEVVCIINPENLASLRVAEKCGFTMSHQAIYHERTVQVLRARLAHKGLHDDPAFFPAGQRNPVR